MASIIQELQSLATDSHYSVTDLLRKAKIVASKLRLKEFLDWINNELNGYNTEKREDIPLYRFINGEPKGWNPMHGWVPVMFDDSKSQRVLSQMPVKQAIGELEDLYNTKSNNLQFTYGPEAQKTIRKAVGFETNFALITSSTAISSILNAVRNIILDWSIKLEAEGIKGDGISFSQKEKEITREPQNIIKIGKIDKFIGNMGHMSDQASIEIVQINEEERREIKSIVEKIKKEIDSIGINVSDKIRIEKNIIEIESELAIKNSKTSIIKESFGSIKRILEGASGNIIAQGIMSNIDKISSIIS
jgi:hypothetical protein